MANNPSSSSSSSDSGSESSGSSSSSYDSSSDEEELQVSEETKLHLDHAKSEYRTLKFKLLQSIKENEILMDELRKHQKKLLRLNRDKYFLFERLLTYEKPPPKTSLPKEEKIEMVDGVPTVVRVGKKRGPKPKKRDPGSPPPLTPNSSLLAAALEPGSSLLRLKSNSIGQNSPQHHTSNNSPSPSGRKRGPKKKSEKLAAAAQAMMMNLQDQHAEMSPSSASNLPVTFSPGFSKSKTLKRQNVVKSKCGKSTPPTKKSTNNPSNMCQQPTPFHHSELSNSTTEDTVMSYRSDSGHVDPEFFRQDSFSQEMPDNLFDD